MDSPSSVWRRGGKYPVGFACEWIAGLPAGRKYNIPVLLSLTVLNRCEPRIVSKAVDPEVPATPVALSSPIMETPDPLAVSNILLLASNTLIPLVLSSSTREPEVAVLNTA